MKYPLILALPLIGLSLLLASCDSGSDPIPDSTPQGEWRRTLNLPDGREHRSTIFLRRDSAFIADTIVSFPNGVETIDSTHATELELTVAGDGYYRAVESHTDGGSDIVTRELRYWYFYSKNDSLYFYRGMRLRGKGLSLPGNWNLSAADSAFLGESYAFSFTDAQVTVTRLSPAGIETYTYPYSTTRDSLTIVGDVVPHYGTRFEIVPGLALYITSHRETGYAEKGG